MIGGGSLWCLVVSSWHRSKEVTEGNCPCLGQGLWAGSEALGCLWVQALVVQVCVVVRTCFRLYPSTYPHSQTSLLPGLAMSPRDKLGTSEGSSLADGVSLLHSTKYMEYYESRDLKAFSAEPLLVYPTHYTGQPGYLSDTETSTIWDNETVSTDWDRTHSWKSRQQGKIHSDAQNKDALPSQSSLNAPSSRDEL